MLSFLSALLVPIPLYFIGRLDIKNWKGFFTAIITIFYTFFIFFIVNLDVYIFPYLPVLFGCFTIFWYLYGQGRRYNNALVTRIITYSMSFIFIWILMSITTTPGDYYWYHTLSLKELIAYSIYFVILMMHYGYIIWMTWEYLSSYIFLIILDIYIICIYYWDNGIYFEGDIDITFHILLIISTILCGLVVFRSIWYILKKHN